MIFLLLIKEYFYVIILKYIQSFYHQVLLRRYISHKWGEEELKRLSEQITHKWSEEELKRRCEQAFSRKEGTE